MLTKCPECELQVSDRAATCPHCGYPLKTSQPASRRKSHMRLPNGFGQITELKNRNLRKPFRVMVTVGKNPQGKPICKLLKPEAYFKTYNEAYAALAEYNKAPYELDSEMTVEELYTEWSKKYFEQIVPSSKRTITSAWAYCTPVYTMRARDLRSRHIKSCMDQAESPNVKNRIKSLFNLMLDYALEYELVDKNYARDFKIDPVPAQSSHMAFTEDEIALLWKYQSIPYVCYILLQTYMGWRPQELCRLRKSDVDWENWEITGGMKTEAGRNRTVPVHKDLIPILKKIKELSDSLGSEWLCPSFDGTELTYDKYNKRFHQVMGEIGMSERHRPHDPRKTFVTLAKAEEVNDFAIKYIVGHAIGDLTEKVYTERNTGWLRTELEKIKTPQNK